MGSRCRLFALMVSQVCAVCLFGVPSTIFGFDYEIQLDPVVHRGMKVSISGVASETRETTILQGVRKLKEDKIEDTIEFEGEITVTETNDRGKATQISCVVSKMKLSELDGSETALKAGTIIEARAAGEKTIYEIGGRPVS
ncbi:hypothetical protein HYR69_01670, partial [Candidatus Sumerlaeota bacterium]|nr:hypothetical protein [Candidatus Sumerlaeota bacterium]